MKRMIIFLIGLVFLFPFFANVSSAAEKSSKLNEVVTINTLPRGLYYTLGAGIAKMIEKYTPIKAFVEPTPNAPASVALFKKGKMEFQMNSAPSIYRELRGTIEFKEAGKLPMRTVAMGVENLFFCVTKKSSDINSIPDLAGKKVMYNTPTSYNASTVCRLAMEYYKVADKVISLPAPHGIQRARYLTRGAIDAFWGPASIGPLQEVESSVGLKIIGVPKEACQYVATKFSGGICGVFPKGYLGLFKEDISAVGFCSGIFCLKTISDETVYTVLKAMYDHFEEMAAMHPQLKKMSLKRAPSDPAYMIVPYHPSAVQFYKDRGVWTDRHDEIQKNLEAELREIEK